MAAPSMKNYHSYEDTMLQLAGLLLPFMWYHMIIAKKSIVQ